MNTSEGQPLLSFNGPSINLPATSASNDIIETAEILRRIERVTQGFERTAVEAAIARREEITPELLHIMEHTATNPKEVDAEENYMAHLYALFLLAQFRETRAYPHVLKLCLLEGELLDSLCGDFIPESLGRVLASVCGGDLTEIQSIVENEDADEWVRGAALDALLTLVSEGQTGRETIVDYFAQLFRERLERQHSQVWNALVNASCDIYPEELLDDIKQAYRDGLVDPGSVCMEDVRHEL